MRIILTGVAGFIGSTLCKQLLELEYKVIGIDNFICGYKKNIEEKKILKNLVVIKILLFTKFRLMINAFIR
jgi:nucleoside-diphosphate-sugar epimerase